MPQTTRDHAPVPGRRSKKAQRSNRSAFRSCGAERKPDRHHPEPQRHAVGADRGRGIDNQTPQQVALLRRESALQGCPRGSARSTSAPQRTSVPPTRRTTRQMSAKSSLATGSDSPSPGRSGITTRWLLARLETTGAQTAPPHSIPPCSRTSGGPSPPSSTTVETPATWSRRSRDREPIQQLCTAIVADHGLTMLRVGGGLPAVDIRVQLRAHDVAARLCARSP